jgi:hypothetical protein
MRILRVGLAAAFLAVTFWGVGDWLLGSIIEPQASAGAAGDFGASAWFTALVVLALTVAATALALYRSEQSSRKFVTLHNIMTFLYVFLVLITVNSIGAWLWPSAVAGLVLWIVSRQRRQTTLAQR